MKSLPVKARADSAPQRGKAYCDKLFALERQFAELSPDERFHKRLEFAKPIMDEFFAWAQALPVMPKSALGVAVNYALHQKPYLENYLLDGRLEISNNRAERSIKPFVIDRKNFLFSNRTEGAKSSGIMFSLIETAKENRLNPYEYLKYIFQNAPNWDIRNNPAALAKLLPDSPDLPECVRRPQNAAKADRQTHGWDD